MKKRFTFLALLLLFTLQTQTYEAVIIKPVVDALGQPYSQTTLNACGFAPYNFIPHSFGSLKSDRTVCPRIHQFIFNERVNVIKETHDEVLVESKDSVYLDSGSNTHQTYWIAKESVCALHELELNGINPNRCIPSTLDQQLSQPMVHRVITLLIPFVNPITKQTYSAGTRFVYVGDDITSWYVNTFNIHSFQTQVLQLPKKVGLDSYHNQDQRSLFVKIIKLYAGSNSHYFAPLVFGGSSLTAFCDNDAFDLVSIIDKKGEEYTYWVRKALKHPASGFDASSLVLRAAQIVGINYHYKNSKTAAQFLPVIQAARDIQIGDIIYIPGSLLVISDVKNNTAITAYSYAAGYGRVIELPLHKIFKDIHTYDELWHHYYNNLPLTILTKDGNKSRTINTFSIHKLPA
ncbi:hypothetical protein Noda2021_04390 [Candidatus Dependentiae bacterium Noda2021]|nr:hypothetical protein Noda2021_04390 [Candidatus Dependentiae bacterium Noda2021]